MDSWNAVAFGGGLPSIHDSYSQRRSVVSSYTFLMWVGRRESESMGEDAGPTEPALAESVLKEGLGDGE